MNVCQIQGTRENKHVQLHLAVNKKIVSKKTSKLINGQNEL